MPWVDRHHEGPDAKAGHRRPNEPGERHGVVVEALSQPNLSDTDLVGAPSLVDEIIDHIRLVRAFDEHYSGRHTSSNRPVHATIP